MPARTHTSLLPRADAVGLGLIGALGSWVLASALIQGLPVDWVLLSQVASIAVLGLGYLVGSVLQAEMPVVVAGSVGVLVVGTVLLGGVGYANAEGAFVVQTLALAWAILLRDPDRRWRAMVTTAAIIGGLVLLTTRSAAGLATLAIVTVAAIVSRAAVDRPQRLLAVFGGLLLLAAAVLAQLAMVRFGAPSLVAAALSQRRLDLWTDAVALVREQPLLGHGPGTFGLLSPTAFANPDTRPAHSVLLETAAELGAVGVVLLVAVVTWGYARLVTSPSRAALVGVAAWTAFWLHALVDYVADYAAVTVMVGLVLGYAVGGPGASQQIRRARYHPA